MAKKKKTKSTVSLTPDPARTTQSTEIEFIPGPKLRAKLGISAVTLWRWRHDEASGFPAPKLINGRLYFPSGAISAWLAKQPEAV